MPTPTPPSFDSAILSLGLVPSADSVHLGAGAVTLPPQGTVSYPDALAPAVAIWLRVLTDSFGVNLTRVLVQTKHSVAPTVQFQVASDLAAGGYQLEISPAHHHPLIEVRAADLAGAFAAVQTLRQLAGPAAYRQARLDVEHGLELAQVTLAASPRFAWRGVLIDVARRFWPKNELLRYLDVLAAHQINVVQLHLTDDQGWRFAVDAYPLLTEVGSWRPETVVGPRTSGEYDGRPHGGFYSREDLREIAAYARARGIEIVPEIDLPGHSMAAIAAYPWLASDPVGDLAVWRTWGISDNIIEPSPAALDFFKTVIDQLIADMNPQYIGIGGDEVPVTNWEKRPDIVQQALDLGFTTGDGKADVRRLSGWFLGELARHISATGRRAVVWDDCVSPELPKDVVVTVWHPGDVAAQVLKAGYDVVLAPENVLYFDYPQSNLAAEPVHFGKFVTLDDVYAYEPEIPSKLPAGAGHVLGIQAQLWGEYLNDPAMRDYNMFPRLGAFAELAWQRDLPTNRQPGSPANQEFRERIAAAYLPRLAAAGVACRPLNGPHPWQQWPGYITKEKPLYAFIKKDYVP